MFTEKVEIGFSKEKSTILERKCKVDPVKNKVECLHRKY